MNKVVVILFVVLVVGVLGVTAFAALNAPAPTGMTVALYDKDGNVVWTDSISGTPFFPHGIENALGAPVATAGVLLSYTVISDQAGATITDVSMSGTIYFMEASAKLPWSAARTQLSYPLAASTAISGSYTQSQDLAALLPDEGSVSSIEYGWFVRVQADLSVTAKVNGVLQSGSWSGYVEMHLFWNEAAAGVGLDVELTFV